MAKMLKRHTYIHLHGALFMSFYDANKVNAIFIRTILNKASAVIVLSETWRKWVLSHSHAKNVFVLFNTVDTSAYKDLIPWEREVSVQKILFMGIIGERKGTYDIIKLIPHIVKVYPNVRFVFAGNGEINKAQMLCKRMGILDKVEFPGWVGGNVKKKYYAEATVYLLPSYNEGFPLSVLEAMAAGLPVITTRVGGISDIVEDNVNGYLINPGDIEAMKNRLFLLLSHQDIRERFGKANKLKAKEFFDVKVIANQLYDLYSSIKIFY
jgi:glycosyltransferase involved in cell wall biosynthesis